MKKFLEYFFMILLLCSFVACKSTGFLMAKPKVLMYGQAYTSKAESEQIEIFSASVPTKDYIEFAQITCTATTDDWNLKQIIIKAREIGADGIILVGKAGIQSVGIPIGNMTYFASEEVGLKAIAIKYKENINQ